MSIEPIPYEGAADFTIGNCHATFACPLLWSKLTETEDPLVRACNSCERKVYMCASLDQVEAQVKADNCIAAGLAPDGEPLFIGEMKTHYATGGVLTWTEQKGLKIAPSPFNQKVDLDGKVNWD